MSQILWGQLAYETIHAEVRTLKADNARLLAEREALMPALRFAMAATHLMEASDAPTIAQEEELDKSYAALRPALSALRAAVEQASQPGVPQP